MKKLGIGQAAVNSNLDYLVQKGWVREFVTPRSFTTPSGKTQQREVRTYKISLLSHTLPLEGRGFKISVRCQSIFTRCY